MKTVIRKVQVVYRCVKFWIALKLHCVPRFHGNDACEYDFVMPAKAGIQRFWLILIFIDCRKNENINKQQPRF